MDLVRCHQTCTCLTIPVYSERSLLCVCQDDSTPVSVFFFDASVSNRRNVLPLAKNALRKLRTIRHPDILKFIDVVETETTIYIVTERVQPLGMVLSIWEGKSAAYREEWLIWGLHRIAVRQTPEIQFDLISVFLINFIDCFGFCE